MLTAKRLASYGPPDRTIASIIVCTDAVQVLADKR